MGVISDLELVKEITNASCEVLGAVISSIPDAREDAPLRRLRAPRRVRERYRPLRERSLSRERSLLGVGDRLEAEREARPTRDRAGDVDALHDASHATLLVGAGVRNELRRSVRDEIEVEIGGAFGASV